MSATEVDVVVTNDSSLFTLSEKCQPTLHQRTPVTILSQGVRISLTVLSLREEGDL